MLILDAFRCLKSDRTKATLRRENIDVAMIPGGMMSLLQPLDVSINKPFKDRLRQRWADWMMQGEKSYTKTGKMQTIF